MLSVKLPRSIQGVCMTMVLTAAVTGSAYAQEDVSGAIFKRIQTAIVKNTQDKVKVDAIHKTPVSGLYQVDSDGEVFYVDDTGRFGLVGASLIDMEKQVDLTAAHVDRKQAVVFKDLPLQQAMKEVRGNGKRKLAVFEDPNCPICKVFTKFVDQLNDVTVYKFMLPVIDPASAALARMAWCAPDRAGTWRSIMAGNRPNLRQDCDTSGLVQILKAAEKYKIQNTPTVFLASGKRLVGATPPEQFMTELDAASN